MSKLVVKQNAKGKSRPGCSSSKTGFHKISSDHMIIMSKHKSMGVPTILSVDHHGQIIRQNHVIRTYSSFVHIKTGTRSVLAEVVDEKINVRIRLRKIVRDMIANE